MAVPFDFEVEPGVSFGEWFRSALEEELPFEEEVEWLDRLRIPAERLQAPRPAEDRLRVLVPWMDGRNAWVVPGPYIYFSRGLLERLPDEACVAFIIAHEVAHHDLGHLDFFKPWPQHLDDIPLGGAVALVLHHFIRRVYSPERELDADRVGLDLCLEAGYDGQACLKAFHILKHLTLDLGAIDSVFGPDLLGKAPETQWVHRAKMWLWQRSLGYLPIEERRRILEEHLATRGT